MTLKQRRLVASVALVMLGWLAHPGRTQAAILKIEPSSGTYTVGQHILVTVMLDTEQRAINAAEATVSWSSDVLQFSAISHPNDIFQYWAFEPVQRTATSAFFSGGLPDPGYTGSGGTIMQLDLVARTAGRATIQLSGGKVLANDGSATSLAVSEKTATFDIIEDTASSELTSTLRTGPTITSSNFPNQQAWYREPVVMLAWTKPIGSTGFSYSMSKYAAVEPEEIVSTTGSATTVTIDGDGVWYFRLRTKYGNGWSASSRYILQYDHTPPAAFTPTIVQDRGLSDPTPVVSFTSSDTISGLGTFTLAIDGGRSRPVTSPYVIEGLTGGTHEIAIAAIDQAGNTQVGKATLIISGTPAPKITNLTTPLLLLDRLSVQGLASAGDTITVYVNQEMIGSAVVGHSDGIDLTPGITIQMPWAVKTDRLFRPGMYQVTATATSTTGQLSASSDPVSFRVSGQAIRINGKSVAIISAFTPIVVLVLSLTALILAVMARAILAVVLMHRHMSIAEDDVERLRSANQRQPLTKQQIDTALVGIEEDLEGGDRSKVRKIQRRRSTKSKRS